MIAQTHRSASFRSLAAYLERPKPHRPDTTRVAWTEPRNLLCSASLGEAAWEISIVARGSERVKKPVYHVSLSWAPEDEPSRGHMTTVADDVMHTLSLADHQSMYVAHADEDYRHLHVMANLVHPNTLRVHRLGLHYRRVEAVLRHAERRFGFREVPGHWYQLPDQAPPDRSQSLSKGAYKALCKGKSVPFQVIVRQVAALDFSEATGWRDLVARLDRYGLRLEARRSGLVVTDGHEYAKSSSVAPGISRRALEERFGEAFQTNEDRARALDMEPSQELTPPVPTIESYGYRWGDAEPDDLGL